MNDNTLATTETLNRHLRRLLRDLAAMGRMEAGTGLSASERLTAALGPELHHAIRAALDHPLPARPSRRVA
jgi:hypothetical protein